jgi:hypothetical protein
MVRMHSTFDRALFCLVLQWVYINNISQNKED